MRNTRYNNLQLVLMAVKDWENFLKLGRIPHKKPLEKTLADEHQCVLQPFSDEMIYTQLVLRVFSVW